jgi:hypothetical protein
MMNAKVQDMRVFIDDEMRNHISMKTYKSSCTTQANANTKIRSSEY